MNIQPKIEAEKNPKDEQARSSSSQMVLYQGRKMGMLSDGEHVHQMVASRVSFMENLIFAYSRILEIDPNRLTRVLPTSIFKMFRRMDALLQQMEQPAGTELRHTWVLFGPRSLTIEEEIVQEEAKDTDKAMILEGITEALRKLGLERKQQLLLAGVSSGLELNEKEARIASFRAEAEKRYLKDAVNVQRRHQIDLSMVEAFRGRVTVREGRKIRQYWEDISNSPDGSIKVAAVHARMQQLFGTSLIEGMDEMIEKMMTAAMDTKRAGGNFKKSAFMVNFLTELKQRTAQKLTEERATTQDSREKIVLDYMLLTGDCQMSFVMKGLLRRKLRQNLQEAEQQVEMYTYANRSVCQLQMQHAQEFITYYQQAIQAAQIKIASFNVENEEDQTDSERWEIQFEKSKIESATKHLEWEVKNLQELQAKTEADFVNEALYTVERREGETPQEIQLLIPAETSFDKIMLQLMNLDTQSGVAKIFDGRAPLLSISSDIELNLNQIADPVDYFVHQLEQRDLQKLELFKSRVDEINK